MAIEKLQGTPFAEIEIGKRKLIVTYLAPCPGRSKPAGAVYFEKQKPDASANETHFLFELRSRAGCRAVISALERLAETLPEQGTRPEREQGANTTVASPPQKPPRRTPYAGPSDDLRRPGMPPPSFVRTQGRVAT